MPRILLIIDEFQELFVEEDTIAQSASLAPGSARAARSCLWDPRAPWGRKRLPGAYSLARSTLGQMAVRIALQCSEADAHSDSERMRTLRPDCSPVPVGGNLQRRQRPVRGETTPFQVVWLPDHEREQYLRELDEHTSRNKAYKGTPAIVFEGECSRRIHRPTCLWHSLLSGEQRARVTFTLRMPGWVLRSRSRSRPACLSSARAAATCCSWDTGKKRRSAFWPPLSSRSQRKTALKRP